MPTYDYTCAKCGQQFEKFQSMNDAALKVCPKDLCAQKRWGKGKVKRHMGSGAGLIFKGSGFYITEYRSDNYKQGAKKDAPPSSGGESKAGESKPSGGESKSPSADSKSAKPEATPAKAEAKPAKVEPKSAKGRS